MPDGEAGIIDRRRQAALAVRHGVFGRVVNEDEIQVGRSRQFASAVFPQRQDRKSAAFDPPVPLGERLFDMWQQAADNGIRDPR